MERSDSFSLPQMSREEMLVNATDFYSHLFRDDKPITDDPNLLDHVRGLGSHVPDLTFTEDLITETIAMCHINKAAGPDLIPMELWKALSHVIAEPLAQICNGLSHDCMPESWQQGKITLISKCKDGQVPQSLNDARPITLLNADYKIFSKALAFHLGLHMPSLTVPEQRAFVHGRDIRHNIILAESILYGSPQPDGALLSLDWAKAYDRVNYSYLEKVLRAYQFNDDLIRKLKATMLGFSLSTHAPDLPQPSFPRERGVGQGCPCAPLLFALAINPLACAIKDRLTGIQVHSCPDIFAKISLC